MAMLCQPKEAAELIEQAATKDGSRDSHRDPSNFRTDELREKRKRVRTAALSILHVFWGLGISAHGAQKLSGWFGGVPINGTKPYGKSSNDFGLF